jgi:uncharacterized protein (TIGR02266 family)
MDSNGSRRIFPVKFFGQAGNGEGVAFDLVPSRLRIRTNDEVVQGQDLTFEVEGPNGLIASGFATVYYTIEFPLVLEPTFEFEAGLKLLTPSESYARLFELDAFSFADYREWTRVPNLLRVQMVGPGFFQTTFALNLSRKGLFVACETEVHKGQIVEVRLFLPKQNIPLCLRGEVVHFLSREDAKKVYGLPGVGLRLLPLQQKDKERFEQYVEYLEEKAGF